VALRWNDTLKTSLAWQDAQHQEVFARVDELLEAMYSGSDVPKLDVLFDHVRASLVKHFATEEQFMLRMMCPGFVKHKEAHAAFLEQLPAVRNKLANATAKQIVEIQMFFATWLRQHILTLDRSAAAHVSQRESSAGRNTA